MKNKIFLFFFTLILISASIIIFLSRSTKKDNPMQPVPTQPEEKTENIKSDDSKITKAISKNYSESSEKYKYQISVNYPFFEDITDKKITDAINSQIETRVQREVDKYIAEARKNKIAPTFGYFTGNYEYSIIPENILSIKISVEKYLSGGANTSNFSIDLNFDLESGKSEASL